VWTFALKANAPLKLIFGFKAEGKCGLPFEYLYLFICNLPVRICRYHILQREKCVLSVRDSGNTVKFAFSGKL